MTFEWDETKAELNELRHGVAFEEAKTVFTDELSITIGDPDHSIQEDRYIDIGYSQKGRILTVAYTERGNKIRIISARKATSREKRQYENQ